MDTAPNVTTSDEEDSRRDGNEGSSRNQRDQDEEGSDIFVDTVEYHHG